MTRAVLILVAPVVTALALGQPPTGQAPEKKFLTKDGKRPSGLFAPGVQVGKTVYIADSLLAHVLKIERN